MRLTTEPAILGSVEFTVRASRFAAHLDADLCWHCSDPEIENLLAETCRGEDEASTRPWTVRYMLYTAAQRLGGQVSINNS
ncbi:hypothetical protein [Mucisphaera calidilacus]|uniref:Uncharacterized protein n=1 Tax=Mucisphaera calidilacus TaxID=2527982 RepID=A0A518BVX0_9BACT|nr:hypothetical protein [Mucisphaera calidilacus]QDU71126.1 hypothetical protein Pan265_09750 [Mucisphaera calidilacus]